MPKLLLTTIKVISTMLIVGVLGLELRNLYAAQSQMTPFELPFPLRWIGRFALVAHFLEGMVAFIYAPSRNQSAIASGIYTFFVGTVGLVELFELQGTKQE
jgi:hypothetical protein